MVEATPSEPTPAEHISELEDQIFDSIDGQIREFNNWCKDLGE